MRALLVGVAVGTVWTVAPEWALIAFVGLVALLILDSILTNPQGTTIDVGPKQPGRGAWSFGLGITPFGPLPFVGYHRRPRQ